MRYANILYAMKHARVWPHSRMYKNSSRAGKFSLKMFSWPFMILNYAVARYDLGAAKIVVLGSKIDHIGLLLVYGCFSNRVALGMSFARKHNFIQLYKPLTK